MFFDILSKLCTEKGISVTQLTTILGISKSNVTNWKNGSIPKSDKIQEIASYFGVTTDYLLGNPPPTLSAEQIEFNTQRWIEKNKYNNLVVEIPVYGSVRAGYGGLAYQEDDLGTLPVISTKLCYGEEYFWLRVKGDSMSPRYLEGDYLLIKKTPMVDNGTRAVVVVNGDEGLVKKVRYGANWIELISENPLYPTRRFEKEEMNEVFIVGEIKALHREE